MDFLEDYKKKLPVQEILHLENAGQVKHEVLEWIIFSSQQRMMIAMFHG